MRLLPRPAALLAAALALGALTAPAGTAAAVEPDPFTVTPLHLKVTVGPDDDEVCDVVADLYTPSEASPSRRVPAVLTTNGFGGSKDDQAGIGRLFASRGYVVLSYSGLGFGGSDCPITLDDPVFDGKAASQLVSYLGGAGSIAFTDDAHTSPAPVLDVVARDAQDHAGVARPHDPRVGMIGGSYGGQVQYAAAAVDARIDALVPMITWHDLSYSLAPNNTGQASPTEVGTDVPGAAKLVWALGFSALGAVGGVQNGGTDPARLLGCPNFADWVCPALVTAGVTGTLDARTVAHMRHASVASYVEDVRVPTLIVQGQSDTLFNLKEGIATFEALRAQGTPVKMVWSQFGHSGAAAPGELDLTDPDPATQHLVRRATDWFDHHLKGLARDTGPLFSYFRDWVSYDGIATPAYASSSTYPMTARRTFHLSGDQRLVPDAAAATSGSQTFTTPVAGVPTSSDPVDVLGAYLPLPEADLPGTAARWTTAPLAEPLDVVGSPTLRLKVSAPVADVSDVTGVAGALTVFVKLYDVDAQGEAELVRDLVAPVRVADSTRRFDVRLPAVAHRFAPGHSLRLVVAGGSTNYRGGLVPTTVTVAGGADQRLELPTSSGDFTTAPTAALDSAPQVGRPVSAQVGPPVPAAAPTAYAWRVGDGVVSRSATYTPRTGDAGRPLSVTVTVSRPGYHDATVTSPARTVAPGTIALVPRVLGPATRGRTLTASTPGLAPSSARLSYAWRADGRPVAGATGRSFVPGVAQVGRRISVTVTAATEGYTTRSVTSPVGARVTEPRLSLRLSTTRATRGRPITVRASGLRPGTVYRVHLDARTVATGRTSATGTMTRRIVLPRSTRTGLRLVRVSGYAPDGSRYNTASQRLRVR